MKYNEVTTTARILMYGDDVVIEMGDMAYLKVSADDAIKFAKKIYSVAAKAKGETGTYFVMGPFGIKDGEVIDY